MSRRPMSKSRKKSNRRKKIGLYGGSFNPPHVCHTLTTVWAMQTHRLDEVWWVPTFQHAFNKDLASFEYRVRMCQLALAQIDGASISQVERDLGGESRTIDTVSALGEQFPNHDYSLIIGSDILDEASRWKNWQGLMEMVDLIVIGRAGHVGDEDPESTEFRLPNISSTRIRDALSLGRYEDLRFWLARDVIDFIADHALYLK
jgi:nicotinate-nucleotide adenylyltransferase